MKRLQFGTIVGVVSIIILITISVLFNVFQASDSLSPPRHLNVHASLTTNFATGEIRLRNTNDPQFSVTRIQFTSTTYGVYVSRAVMDYQTDNLATHTTNYAIDVSPYGLTTLVGNANVTMSYQVRVDTNQNQMVFHKLSITKNHVPEIVGVIAIPMDRVLSYSFTK